jgi:hypothetical protein
VILTHFWLGFWELKHRSNWVLELELSPGCCPCPCSASINSLVCCWVPRASRALAEERQESGTGTDRRGWKRLKVGGFTESDDIWWYLMQLEVGVFRTFSENGHMKHWFHVEDLPAEPSLLGLTSGLHFVFTRFTMVMMVESANS